MTEKADSYDVPRPAVMAAAVALAEVDGTEISQSYLRDAEKAVEAARCTVVDGCQFFKGHDLDCSPALNDRLGNRDELAQALQVMLTIYGKDGDPVTEVAKDALARYS